MFRFSIRELMLVTLVAALVIAWAIDHRAVAASRDRAKTALAEVKEDAESLARFGDPHRGACGQMVMYWTDIARKYWPTAGPTPTLVIVTEDEARLGLNTEAP
jgi:hypothetical protein